MSLENKRIEGKITTKNRLLKTSLVTTILLISLTLNAFVVQAGGSAIALIINGEGEIEVTALSNKGDVKNFGSFVSSDTIRIPGNIASVNFTLRPNTDTDPPYHVSAVVQDGNYIPFGDVNLVDQDDGTYTYTLNNTLNIKEKWHTIDVTFSKGATAIVPANTAATVFLGSTASLTVNNTENGVPITFNGTELEDFPNSILVWNITRDESNGNVTVTLRFTWDPNSHDGILTPIEVVRLWQTDLEYPNADINGDNRIDGTDVSAVANINPGTGPGDKGWNSTMDINGDKVIDNFDVNIVSQYNPLDSVWVDITDGWEQIGKTDEWLVFGVTDQFSLFKCR